MRILIVGGPRTGKTTLAESMALDSRANLRHTDDLIGVLDWSAASAEVATWMDSPTPWIIEGVAVTRALRKWLAAYPDGKPADKIIYMSKAFVETTTGQGTMAKGVATVWSEILPQLVSRGVEIEVR